MKVLALAFTLLLAGTSQAQDRGWICGLAYKGEAKGFQVIAGKFKIEMAGDLKCERSDGEKRELPVKIKIAARKLAPVIAMGKYKVYGASANIALLTHEPEDLMGNYFVAQAQAAIIGGVGVFAGTHLNQSDLTLYLSVNVIKGFGFNVGVTRMTMEVDQSRLN